MPYKKEFSQEGKYFKPIDWLLVQGLIDQGLSGIEIAKRIGIHPNSLYARVFKEHGWYFTHWQHKRLLIVNDRDYDPYPHIKTFE